MLGGCSDSVNIPTQKQGKYAIFLLKRSPVNDLRCCYVFCAIAPGTPFDTAMYDNTDTSHPVPSSKFALENQVHKVLPQTLKYKDKQGRQILYLTLCSDLQRKSFLFLIPQKCLSKNTHSDSMYTARAKRVKAPTTVSWRQAHT